MNKLDVLNLSKSDWVSLGKGALVAVAGALLTYAAQHVTASDFGTAGPLVVAALSVLVNYFRKVTTADVVKEDPVDPDGPRFPTA